jgi:hypothetical protein
VTGTLLVPMTRYFYFFMFDNYFLSSSCRAPSLTRGRVVVCSAITQCSESPTTRNFAVLSETLPTCRARSPYLYPLGTGWPSYTLVASYYSQDYGEIIRTRLHTGRQHISSQVKVKVKVTLRMSISQSVYSGVEPPLGFTIGYSFLFDGYCLVHVGRPL